MPIRVHCITTGKFISSRATTSSRHIYDRVSRVPFFPLVPCLRRFYRNKHQLIEKKRYRIYPIRERIVDRLTHSR